MDAIPRANDFYAAYVCFFSLTSFDIRKKEDLMLTLTAGESWSWRVIGISEAALELLAQNDFRRAARIVCRAHIVDRIDTVRAVFEKSSSPLPQVEFLKLLFENERTAITTRPQNTPGGPPPPSYIQFNSSQSLFRNRSTGYSHGLDERNYLRGLYADYKNGKVGTVKWQ